MTQANPNSPALSLPPQIPRVHDGVFVRGLGRNLLRIGGWRMEGAFPDLPRAVLIGAPHSSNWDGFWGLTAKIAMGIDIRIFVKDSIYETPVILV